MSKLDSLESIRKDYEHTITINGREGGIFRCWVRGFKDVTMVCLWVEFPNCNGELTPMEIEFKPNTENRFTDITDNIKTYDMNIPDNWRKLKI